MNRNEGDRNGASGGIRRDLLHELISPWKRRGRKLLQIGGSPLVPPSLFWEAGFDAFCIEGDFAVLNAAREENGQIVEYFLGQPDLLPFDDDSFDYAVLPDLPSVAPSGVPAASSAHPAPPVSAAPPADALRAVIAEGARVASHGVILMSGNPLFPANWGKARNVRGFWPWELWLTARRAAPGACMTLRSACGFPFASWAFWKKKPCARNRDSAGPAHPGCNSHSRTLLSPLPLGAVYGLRLGWTPLAGTPVGALRVPGLGAYGSEAAVGSPGLRAGNSCATPEGLADGLAESRSEGRPESRPSK